jgi:RNA polymerase sigma-70 factor (ECF subfamily)
MDETHFRNEYGRVADQLYTFLMRTVGDPDSAADILQEAAYRAYRSRKKFRGESSFKTWIYRIAINTVKNHWVRNQREMRGSEAIKELGVMNSPTPENLFTGKEKASELSRALMMLKEEYRIPFMLKHLDGLSYREISEVLGITENSARVKVYRARHVLRKTLEEDRP